MPPASRIRATGTPSAWAESSPRARALRAGETARATTSPSSRVGSTGHRTSRLRPGQRSGEPEACLVEGALVHQHHRRRPGQQHELEHGAAEREPYRVDVPGPAGECLGEESGGGRAGEREPHVLDGAGELQREDGDDHRESGARVDAERGGRGERVAGDALRDRAGDPERGAHREADDRARQPQPGHHQRLPSVGVPEQRVGHGGQGHRAGAEGETQRGAEHQGAEAGEEERYVLQSVKGHTCGWYVPLGRGHELQRLRWRGARRSSKAPRWRPPRAARWWRRSAGSALQWPTTQSRQRRERDGASARTRSTPT